MTTAPSTLTTGVQAGGCPATKTYPPGTQGIADGPDYVYLHEQYYFATQPPRPITAALRDRLGPHAARVTCTIVDLEQDGNAYLVGKLRNGNALLLPTGSWLYRVPGYGARCRLAAVREGYRVEYIAQRKNVHPFTPVACAKVHQSTRN